MRVEGYFWCPRCFCRQIFVPTYDAAPGDPYPPIECSECGYVFRQAKVEDPTKPGSVAKVDVISPHQRDMARIAYAQKFLNNVVKSGFTLKPEHRKHLANKHALTPK